MGILTMKQSIFGNKFKERKLSKNARKAMVSEMYIPTNAVEMTYDEMECVDGGGWILFKAKCTVGGMIASFGVGFTTSFLISCLATMVGKKVPTWVGKLIGIGVGATLGAFMSSQINKDTDYVEIPIFAMWLPFVSFKKTLDLGDKLYDLLNSISGGIGGGFGGAAAGAMYGTLVGALA